MKDSGLSSGSGKISIEPYPPYTFRMHIFLGKETEVTSPAASLGPSPFALRGSRSKGAGAQTILPRH
uniref:Uncharacterized protein n=1 Tax=Amphimedon queenslandica TaxID=400682 RepID=A0A1X7SH64_AMPQE